MWHYKYVAPCRSPERYNFHYPSTGSGVGSGGRTKLDCPLDVFIHQRDPFSREEHAAFFTISKRGPSQEGRWQAGAILCPHHHSLAWSSGGHVRSFPTVSRLQCIPKRPPHAQPQCMYEPYHLLYFIEMN